MRSSILPLAALAVTLLAPVWSGVPGPLLAQAGRGERTLFVTALDSQGEPVENLAPEHVIIREDGLRREVLRLSRAVEPLDVALLVDNSAAAEGAIPQLREGLSAFVNALAPGTSVALVGLADRPTILVDYTTDRARLAEGIGRIFAMPRSGMTSLDAIVEVSRGFSTREAPRRALVIVMTEGIDFSNRDYGSVLDALSRSGASLHAITIGTPEFPGQEPYRSRAVVLDRGTRSTGGARQVVLTSQGVPQALDRLGRALASQYKVTYVRPDSLIPPEKVEIESNRPGVVLRATPAREQTGN